MQAQVDDPLSACLLWLAESHGRTTSRDALVDGLPIHGGRLSPSLFERAAERVHLTSHFVKQPLTRLNNHLLPCIILLNGNNACIVESVNWQTGQWQVLLPELGMQPSVIEQQSLNADYAGIVIYCSEAFRPEPLAAKPNHDSAASGHWFWSVIRASRPIYRDVLLAAFFINLFALAMPLFVMNVYDRVIPNQATETLWVLALGVFIIICADLILRILRSWFVEIAANRNDIKLSSSIMERILGMRLEHHPSSIGSFASSVQSFESVRTFIGSMTVTALIDLPFFLLFAVIIMLIAWPLVIPLLIGAAIVILYALAVQSKMRNLSDVMGQASAQRSAGLIESLATAETLKSFNATGKMQAGWEQATKFLAGCSGKLRMLGISVSSGASWTQHSVSISIIILGVYLTIDGQMSMGALIAAYMLSSRAMAPVAQTASLLTQYHQAATALDSLEQIMTQEQERTAGKQLVSRPQLRGNIHFQNVSFSYPGAQRNALSDISLKIDAGERIGILGRVGSGKSTLEKLLMGLYRPTSGEILLDGLHIEQIDLAELRRSMSYVPQDVQLMTGSVYDNMTLGVEHPSNDDMLKAVELSGLNSLIGSHADGLGMQVGESGSKLSGGQRQTIAVARSFMVNGSILLLDEPTSAMDSNLENHVTHSIKEVSKDKTLILITHRASMLSLVDRLIVLDGGKVIADGAKARVLEALENGSLNKVTP